MKWLIELGEGLGVVLVAIIGVILWTAPSSVDFLLKVRRTWKGQRIR